MIVYKMTNKANGKVYIGATTKALKERFCGHRTKVKTPMYSEIKKWGADNFTMETIFEAKSKEEMYEMEKFFIEKFNAYEPTGYNKQAGGKNGVGRTELARERQSEAQKRRFRRDGAARLGTIGKLSPRSKPVLCIENGTIYESARQAAIALGIKSRSSITMIIKGQKKSIHGYTFKYA